MRVKVKWKPCFYVSLHCRQLALYLLSSRIVKRLALATS
jgi:hypothetical protein